MRRCVLPKTDIEIERTSKSMGTACEKVLRVLEFYSGIGGMRYSLKESGIQATIVEAFDINNIANEVYKHNFGRSPYQGNIQSLSVGQLDKFQADAWLLSPPCQPYTRQGLQKDADDARACSFLKLLELIPRISFPPAYLLMENVVGFETSLTHQKMIEVLEQNEYITQEFILNPLQFGIPYSRPRYFCLAKRRPLSFCFPKLNGKLVLNASHVLEGSLTCLLEVTTSPGEINEYEYSTSCRPIKDFLQADVFRISTSGYRVTSSSSQLKTDDIMTIEKYNNMDQHCNGCNMETIGKEEVSESESYVVSSELIERWGDAMDVVFPDSKRCCCFTKSYGRYVKGTGSLLATSEASVNGMSINENNWKQFTKTKCSVMQNLKLRYFTPREIANLHSLPEDFSFPSHLSRKQRYALLGNSISVAVVAPLLKYLFTQ